MPNPHLRLRCIRFKSGGEIRLLDDPWEKRRATIEENVRNVLDVAGPKFAGYAFVVWQGDGSSTCSVRSSETIPLALIPDFVRNRLLAEVILGWVG